MKSFLEKLNDTVNYSPEENELVKWWASVFQETGKEAFTYLSSEEKKLLPKLEFGILPTWEGNAWPLAMPDGSRIIAIDMLLPTSLLHVSRMIVEQMKNAEQGLPEEQFYESNRILWLSAKFFLTRKRKYADALNDVLAKSEDVRNYRETFFWGLVRLQLLFIAMHEIQHILCKHPEEIVQMQLKSPNTDDKIVKMLKRKREHEFEADKMAVLALARSEEFMEAGAYSVCEILFFFFHVLEIMRETPVVVTTHPKAIKRLERIREIFDENNNENPHVHFRRTIDSVFQNNLVLITDKGIPESTWLHPSGLQNLFLEYRDAVLSGKIQAHVSIFGPFSPRILECIEYLTHLWLASRDLTSVSMLDNPRFSLEKNEIINSLSRGFAMVACVFTRYVFMRNEAMSENQWSSEYLKKFVQRMVDPVFTIENVSDFNPDVDADGEVCKLHIGIENTPLRYMADVRSGGGTIHIYVTEVID